MRINIGCGQSPTAGWENFDNSFSLKLARIPQGLLNGLISADQARFVAFCRKANIRYANAARQIPVASGTVEVIYSSHMFEHLSRRTAQRFLAEVLRVLKPGGVLRLAVPDLHQLARAYLEHGDADRFVADSLLATPDLGALRALLIGFRHHRWMYDARSLCRLLETNGLQEARVYPAGTTRIPDPGALNLFELAEVSIYVEAVKPHATSAAVR